MESDSAIFDRTRSIADFLIATAARQPTPGGGAVAALSGALAAAIGEMTLRYSIGKKTSPETAAALEPSITRLSHARRLLLELMVEDQSAYGSLAKLHKLPADDWGRTTALPGAVLTCIRVPQAIGATALAVLELCNTVVELANPRLLSDLAVSAELAMATVRCAVYNCRTNFVEVADTAQRGQIEADVEKMLQRGVLLIQQVIPRIWERHEQAAKSPQA